MNEATQLLVDLRTKIAACVAAAAMPYTGEDSPAYKAAIDADIDIDDFIIEHGEQLVLVLGAVTGTAHDDVVQIRECNACDWKGPVSAAVMCGSVGPLCPECRETTEAA